MNAVDPYARKQIASLERRVEVLTMFIKALLPEGKLEEVLAELQRVERIEDEELNSIRFAGIL